MKEKSRTERPLFERTQKELQHDIEHAYKSTAFGDSFYLLECITLEFVYLLKYGIGEIGEKKE